MQWKRDFIISLKDKRHIDPVQKFRPLSGKFVEYLAGLTMKNLAQTATYSNAMELIAQTSMIAVDLACSDALTRMQCLGQTKLITQSLPTFWNEGTFAADYVSGLNGLEVIKYNPQYQPLSTWRVSRINLLANDTVSGKQVFLIDGSDTITFTVDIEAGKAVSIDLTDSDGSIGYLVKHPERFSVVWDTSDVRPAAWTWANENMNNSQSCGCTSQRAGIYGRWYYVQGNNGISVDMAYICDYSRLERNIAYMMNQAILYKFGSLICDEIIASDRINFFVNNSLEWAEKKKTEWEDLYSKELEKVLPSLSHTVQSIDRNCFETRRNVFTEMRV